MPEQEKLSPWWKHAVIVTVIFGFTVLMWLAVKTYHDAPPLPETVVSPTGETIFTQGDILAGQQVFLKYGLMENGTIWGHGAYLGPDFSAAYLHTLAIEAAEIVAKRRYDHGWEGLTVAEQNTVGAEVQQLLKQNRYDPRTKTLIFTEPEIASYQKQIARWATYFSQPTHNAGLPVAYIKDPEELQQLTAFLLG